RHLRRHPAPGRHEGRQEHHRHQQGQGRAHLLDRRPGRRGRRPQGGAQAHRGPPGPALMAASASSTLWENWGGNQQCAAEAVDHPADEAELCASVKAAAAAGQPVKAVGSGHSFTDIACTYGRRLVLDRYSEILSVDRERLRVTVQSGCTIRTLNRRLAELNWALPNLGDIEYQTISGAISTATHGTGVRLGGLATQVVGLELVTGDGSVLRCSADEEPEVFAVARVGLGALGVLSTVTLQCVPAFNLHAIEEPMRLDHVLENLDGYVEDNDHFEFYYVPHTG